MYTVSQMGGYLKFFFTGKWPSASGRHHLLLKDVWKRDMMATDMDITMEMRFTPRDGARACRQWEACSSERKQPGDIGEGVFTCMFCNWDSRVSQHRHQQLRYNTLGAKSRFLKNNRCHTYTKSILTDTSNLVFQIFSIYYFNILYLMIDSVHVISAFIPILDHTFFFGNICLLLGVFGERMLICCSRSFLSQL